MKFNKTQVLILAGGRGSRIKKLSNKIPKPLIKFENKDLLGLIIRNLTKYNFKEIIILAGYKGQQIKKKYHNKLINFVKIKCVIEKKRMGTWGSVIQNKKLITNNFILLNGDTFFNYNFIKLKSINLKFDINLILTKNHNYFENKKLTGLYINNKNHVIKKKNSTYINSGTYIIKKKILRKYQNQNMSIENDVIEKKILNNEIGGTLSNDFLIDIGTKSNLKYAQEFLIENLKKPAIFLDRDGVINYDSGYVYKFKNFKFKEGVLPGLKYLSKKNLYIFIVTNQAGIAKKKFLERDFYLLHKKLKNYFLKKDIFINDVIYCPFHNESLIKRYRKNSKFRKPGNLMIENLIKKWPVDRKKSFMIGDQKTDEIAANKSSLYFRYTENEFDKLVIKICKKRNI